MLEELLEEAAHRLEMQAAKIEKANSDKEVAYQIMRDREKMPIPYDENEFLRQAILIVIGWVEKQTSYRIFETITLTKTRIDEIKATIEEKCYDR